MKEQDEHKLPSVSASNGEAHPGFLIPGSSNSTIPVQDDSAWQKNILNSDYPLYPLYDHEHDRRRNSISGMYMEQEKSTSSSYVRSESMTANILCVVRAEQNNSFHPAFLPFENDDGSGPADRPSFFPGKLAPIREDDSNGADMRISVAPREPPAMDHLYLGPALAENTERAGNPYESLDDRPQTRANREAGTKPKKAHGFGNFKKMFGKGQKKDKGKNSATEDVGAASAQLTTPSSGNPAPCKSIRRLSLLSDH